MVPLFGVHVPQKDLDGPLVPLAVKEDAVGLTAIPAGAAWLLIVVFEGLGKASVDHESDVLLVDAHAEGHGGDDDIDVILHPLLLDMGSLVFFDFCMVKGG